MAKLSPIGNNAQFINGIPANGAKLFTYAAGSSTKQTTYTDEAGTIPQTNPIILDSRGEPAQPIWLTEGLSYKFVFTASTDSDPPVSPIWDVDDVTGVNDSSVAIDQWIDSGVTPTYVSATQFTMPGDQTSSLQVGRRVKLTVTAGTVYGTITASAYAALTTATLSMDGAQVLDSGLSSVSYGILTPQNSSFPVLKDTDFKISGSADATKNFRLEVDGFTTATTRVATPPDKDITLAGLVDLRNYLAGLTMSTAGSSATMSIAAGQASDSTNAFSMTLAAIAKTTSAWAVGTGNGGLDTGAIANSTWYYFYAIRRPDTGVTDVVFSLSSSAPTLPANYTQYRYIGGGLTNGSAQWVAFTQTGDDFYWSTPVADFSGAGSAAAATLTCTVPRGRKVKAYFHINVTATAQVILTDLANADVATTVSSNAGNGGVASVATGDLVSIWTNTSAQVRHRESGTGGILITTAGWMDLRDKGN
jgi:hypothetical protein